MDMPEKPPRNLWRRLILMVGGLWLFLPLTFVVPWLNSTSPPYFDLTGGIGVFAHAVALSVGSDWGPWVIIFLMVVLVSRPGCSARQRIIEFVAVGLAVLVFQGGGSELNERGLKEYIKEPRPHIKQLARAPASPSGGSILGMTAEAFYDTTVAARRAYLCDISGYDELEPSYRYCRSAASSMPSSPRQYCFEEYADETLHLHPRVCRHWISTTGGFSFPSGHAYAAMFLAAFWGGLALSLLSGWRLRFFQFLVMPWTVLVAYSRVVLRVHSPLDLTVGGLLGLIVGLVAFVLVRAVLKRVGLINRLG